MRHAVLLSLLGVLFFLVRGLSFPGVLLFPPLVFFLPSIFVMQLPCAASQPYFYSRSRSVYLDMLGESSGLQALKRSGI